MEGPIYDDRLRCPRRPSTLKAETRANAYVELRRPKDAIGCFRESLAIFQETGDRYATGTALIHIGRIYEILQQPDQAAACRVDAAAALRDAGDHEQAAHIEQLAPSTQSQPRRRWGLRRRSSS